MANDSMYGSLVGQVGFIPLHLHNWRLVASNDVPAIAVASGNGGNLAVDTSPKLKRVSTSTDKCLRIEWASSTSIEIFHQFFYPPDMDVTATYSINLRVAKNTNTDTTVIITADLFEGIGDTTRGASVGAIAVSTLATYSATITPTGGHPNFAVAILTPGTHTTDTIYLYEAYVTYKKKLASV